MIDTSASRAAILAKIQSALAVKHLPAEVDPSNKWLALPRSYRQANPLTATGVLDLLEDRLRNYDAQVVHATGADLARTISRMVEARGLPRMLMPAGLDPSWLPGNLVFTTDQDFSAADLNGFDGVLTGATLAIAETGTLVLQNVPGQGRRAATLVPDYHLCVVRSSDVVATVPEAIRRLHATATLPTTFVSGPSATADIEMTRIKGVHGPRFLDVILLAT